jgi:PRTRC genetic system protein E
MLITNLLPLLARYSLGFDLVAAREDTVTLTVMPRKAPGATVALEAGEVRPISITATAAEIDAELARGTEGALGQLFVARKELGDQLAEQRDAAEAAKTAAAAKAKPAPAKAPAKAPAAAQPAAEAAPDGPASLW